MRPSAAFVLNKKNAFAAMGICGILLFMSEKLVKVSDFNSLINALLNADLPEYGIFRSKGLLTHLLKRKHFVAAKYLDFLPDIISAPDFAGITDGVVELVKRFKDDIFISIKLDSARKLYYVATMYEVSKSKVERYCKNGRLKIVHAQNLSMRKTLTNCTPCHKIMIKFDEQERHPALP